MKSKFEINVDDKKVNINITKFSDGTIQMNLGLDAYLRGGDIINVEASIVDNDGIIALCQLKDIIDNYFPKTINTCLSLQYIPYARYDRRMVDGDSFSLKVFTNILNSLNFDLVFVRDAHSAISTSLINNCIEISQSESLALTIENLDEYNFIVSPDLGAVKKAEQVSESYKIPLVRAIKKRDVATGYTVFDSIIDIKYIEELVGSSVIIIDDICDGGATFSNLAQNLKEQYGVSKVDLLVTHGIFKNGRNIPYVDDVKCLNDLEVLIYPERFE